MAIEHALLGLLEIQPRHGYELSKEFATGTVLGDIVHLEPGMLYANLKKLQRAGWVDACVEQQEGRPPRRIFELTAEGKQELDRWLAEPVERTRDIRLEFVLKLYLARIIDPAQARRLTLEQREMCNAFIESLEEQLSKTENDFHRLVLEMRLAQNQSLARWLEQAAGEIAAVSN